MNRTIPFAMAVLVLAPACASTSTRSRITNAPSAMGGGPVAAAPNAPQSDVVAGSEVPAGTRILARMNTRVTSASKNGDAFTATIGSPVMDSSGHALIPQGSTLTGRVWSARPGRWIFGRNSHITLGVDGAYVHGTFVPLAADVVSADVRTNRAGILIRERAAIPEGTSMEIQLRQAVPVSSLLPNAAGGGPTP